MLRSIRENGIALFRHIGSYLVLMSESVRGPIYDVATYRQNLARQMRQIGVLAVVALALLFLGVRFLQGVPLLGNTCTLVAQFDKVEGITDGTPVTV